MSNRGSTQRALPGDEPLRLLISPSTAGLMPSNHDKLPPDPVFVHARREAKVILVIFLLFGCYTLAVSYWLGLNPAEDSTQSMLLVFGMPAWVFWGVVVPWIAANFVTAWFCFAFMRDDEVMPHEQDASESNAPTSPVGQPTDGGDSATTRTAGQHRTLPSTNDEGDVDV